MNHSQFLYLTTKGWKTGRQHSIEIWYVDYNDKYYIMSEHLKRAHWVQNIIHNPSVLFTVNEKTFEGTARLVDQEKDAKLASQIANLMGAKYKWDRGLIVEIIPD
ncbi:MAG: nitroreductase/quinone reductase family protein [Candidatus Nitrosopolaris sp.]|jgi:deazaflavin-dependent oxidoreductase (nitroreductase family)